MARRHYGAVCPRSAFRAFALQYPRRRPAHGPPRRERPPFGEGAWLAIDPKPFVGDPTYDATQHLFNCQERMLDRPWQVTSDFAARLGVDPERLRPWTFARAAEVAVRARAGRELAEPKNQHVAVGLGVEVW